MFSAVDLTTGPVLGAVSALGIMALAAIWFVPRWQARGWAKQGIVGKELADLENSARVTIVQGLGGVGLILTFAATWMQISDTRTATERTLRLTATQQETERFTRAVEQLTSSRLEGRIGGIYGLAAVAAESERRRAPIAQILLTYLQQRHRVSRETPKRVDAETRSAQRARDYGSERDPLISACGSARLRKSADDMQAILGVVVGLSEWARPQYKLARLDLQFSRAQDANFSNADLTFSYLTGAQLERARFDRATLSGTDFTHACLREASFIRARGRVGLQALDAADLRSLGGPSLTFRRNLSFADADLRGADLRDADFAFASFRGADLRGADLRGADVHGTTLTRQQRAGARIDACTRLADRAVPASCPDLPG